MPEGPEARTVADQLREKIIPAQLISLSADERGKLFSLEKIFLPAEIRNISTYGKKVLFTADKFLIVVSLGMSGRLRYDPGAHSHIHFRFLHQNEIVDLYFDDARYFGRVEVLASEEITSYFDRFGPDLLEAALTVEIPLDYWEKIITNPRRKNTPICKLLLEQEFVAGIGNYLKSEILYFSGILPSRKLGSLLGEEIERLREMSHQVILSSYLHGGFTLHSYISPDNQRGVYPAAVYGRKKDPQGNVITSGKTADGRTSYWVPGLQI